MKCLKIFCETEYLKMPSRFYGSLGELMRHYLQHLILDDQIIQEDNLAACQYLFAKGHDHIATKIMSSGFIAFHDGAKFSCGEQQFIDILPEAGKNFRFTQI